MLEKMSWHQLPELSWSQTKNLAKRSVFAGLGAIKILVSKMPGGRLILLGHKLLLDPFLSSLFIPSAFK